MAPYSLLRANPIQVPALAILSWRLSARLAIFGFYVPAYQQKLVAGWDSNPRGTEAGAYETPQMTKLLTPRNPVNWWSHGESNPDLKLAKLPYYRCTDGPK